MNSSYIVKQLIGTLVFFSLIFLSAGRLNYEPGLLYLGIGLVMMFLSYTVFQLDADLLAERAKPATNTKAWDKKILGLSFLATIAMFIIAGLDSGRFHWSPALPQNLMITGGVLTMLGQLTFLIAQKQNTFFSSTARIQTNRQHQVVSTGFYSFIRHPAYFGSIIQAIGFPLLFGSLWSIVPVVLSIGLLITRTKLEDEMLMAELSGYQKYAQKTKYRLLPWVW